MPHHIRRVDDAIDSNVMFFATKDRIDRCMTPAERVIEQELSIADELQYYGIIDSDYLNFIPF